MNYQNIFELQKAGFSFDEAIHLDAKGFSSCNIDSALDYLESEKERMEDLEERGFYHGTDNPYLIDQIESGEIFQDKLDLYANEY